MIVSTAFGSTPPPLPLGLFPLLGYSYNPLIRLADYQYFTLDSPLPLLPRSHRRLHSVVVLHCLGGQCPCLGLGVIAPLALHLRFLGVPLGGYFGGSLLVSVSGIGYLWRGGFFCYMVFDFGRSLRQGISY